jgi:hypothetical protein
MDAREGRPQVAVVGLVEIEADAAIGAGN